MTIFEGGVHRRGEPVGLRLADLALGEVAAHLLEDAGAPKRRVQLELGQPKQRVAKREGIENVGVEDGASDHGVDEIRATAVKAKGGLDSPSTSARSGIRFSATSAKLAGLRVPDVGNSRRADGLDLFELRRGVA